MVDVPTIASATAARPALRGPAVGTDLRGAATAAAAVHLVTVYRAASFSRRVPT